MLNRWSILLVALAFAFSNSCKAPEPSAPDQDSSPSAVSDPVEEALAIADAYVEGFYRQYPEQAHLFGYPDAPMDRLGDHSAENTLAWTRQQDAWLAALSGIDPSDLQDTAAEVPAAYVVERLEAARDLRSCSLELWNVNPTWRGWQVLLPSMFGQQPVSDEVERQDALARLRAVPSLIDTDIDNLRRGLEAGLSAPKSAVDAVMVQIEGMLAAEIEDSPFWAPAEKAALESFTADWTTALESEVLPAVERYRAFLVDEYRDQARDLVGVAALPGGESCYAGSVRFYTSVDMAPQAIHEAGLRRIAEIEAEMATIAERSFGGIPVAELLVKARSEPEYTFETAEEILAYVAAAIERAEAAVPETFGFVPSAALVVEPFPDFQKRTGGGLYRAPAPDGSRPGIYNLGTFNPRELSKAGLEATVFHETWPGHHQQLSTAQELGAHPALTYFFNSGFGEGWALYAERLADELGLYNGDLDRLGMLSNESLRAARLVVDPGLHVLGWDRQQAIDYLLAHTTESPGSAASQIDRYISVPGQATAYLLGSLEIQRLRAEAKAALGEEFELAAFHDAALDSGTIDLRLLERKIERFIERKAGS